MAERRNNLVIGGYLYDLACSLWPICRSITGAGFRESLSLINAELNDLIVMHAVPSGYKAFDWVVPDEWNIRDGWIEDENGHRLVDFKKNNLHVVGYSERVDVWLDFDSLDEHLYSLPDQPDAIPYVTSYYERRWGFCLAHNQRQLLRNGQYRAVIDADLNPGVLNYDTEQEVFLSTYICHPSMANNELSGPVVITAIARWLISLSSRRYTYRIIYIPETIGSLVYLSKNLDHLKKYVIAGFNVTCIGDDRCYSYLPSRSGNTMADRAAQHALHHIDPNFIRYTWLDRGSDERQYCSPSIDLPIATIMRSKYGAYPEYHTSLDNLNFVTPSGLEGGYNALKTAIEAIELNCLPKATVLGEPQLGKRGLYPSISKRGSTINTKVMMDLLTYADGKKDLLEIADLIDVPINQLREITERLVDYELISYEEV